MEQLDAVHSQTVTIEESKTLDLPPTLDSEVDIEEGVKIENTWDNLEGTESSCPATTVETKSCTDDQDEPKKSEETHNEQVTSHQIDEIKGKTEIKEETIENVVTTNNEQCKEDAQLKEEKVQTEVKHESLSATDEKTVSLNNETKAESTDAVVKTIVKEDICTVSNIDTTDDPSVQCRALLKSFSQDFEGKEHSSEIADADLTKLVDGNSEIVVLTVETVPITESIETAHEDYVVTVHEENVTVSSHENNPLSLEGKENKKPDIVNEEFDLIDYSQESDGTIIEVISTEVVHSEDTESFTPQDCKENVKAVSADSEIKSSITVECTNNANVVANVEESKEMDVKEKFNKDAEETLMEVEPKTNVKDKTEACDSSDKSTAETTVDHTKTVVVATSVDSLKTDSISASEASKLGTATKKRSVIQDIFDDWGDENADDESQPTPKTGDTVEIQLKSLLDDSKSGQTVVEETVVLVEEEIVTANKESITDTSHHVEKPAEIVKEKKDSQTANDQPQNQNIKKQLSQNVSAALKKEQTNVSTHQKVGKSPKTTVQDTVSGNQTSQPHAVPVVSRGRNLSSQIASQAEVTEALKERLREKQKIVEAPRGPDIFFVKKLTQRLSSKLAGGPVSPIPALIPLPHPVQPSANNCDQKAADAKTAEPAKESSTDNKELLAILEGDVDPDWSNLKPPTLTEEGKTSANVEHYEQSTPPKLDPLVERELALKQLLELPVAPTKRNASRKKKTFKPAPNKVVEEKNVAAEKKEIVNIDLVEEGTDSAEKKAASTEPELTPADSENQKKEKEKVKDPETPTQDVRLDESRSGRKRKPTERAREHEQNTTKRQKVYKGKIAIAKKQVQENDVEANTSLVTDNHSAKENTPSASAVNSEENVVEAKETTIKEFPNKPENTVINKPENSPLKRPKQSLTKKGSQPIAKRKIVVKKLLRQNITSNKKSVNLKAKLTTPSKKSGSKIVAKSQKRTAEASTADAKPKKKIINEIDRLLQDEGVVNLLYDVEQPDKKRLVPITKSQAKVMDIQKVQRELKIRKKLVRNAVLRLRTSSGVTKVSPRSKRTSVHVADARMDRKASGEQDASLKAVNSATSEFIFPAKIRNAADASIIIRRHSSSSFSSASGSPRVSIDGPEKSDGLKSDEGGPHSLRSTKRRHSQDERINVKKSKKKAVMQKADAEITVPNAVEEKTVAAIRPTKKIEPKKADKSSKQVETVATDETNSNPSKVITRSNGTTTGKVTSKSKKSTKNKVTFAKPSEPDNVEEPSKEEDELSACLAEAATALSVVNAGSRSGNAASSRKNKANANVAKASDPESAKTKTETRSQFSNKEINVRRHGNLVQLILTPSSSTKIRNALTLQLMQEFRETLTILKKDDECRVVLLTSTGTSFCEGLELSMVLHTNKEERRLKAQELADGVKDFIKSLASFNKPIVAGVQGAAIGLGVTMLPLFDLVIASDKATFSTPYGKLGQIAEGAAVFTLSHILGSAITSELLLGGRTLTASEALRAGLVTRVLWPDRFQVELLPTLRAMGEQSSQSMEATKALLRHSLRKKLDAALESETYLLIQHWCSAECQSAIKAYMDGKVQ